MWPHFVSLLYRSWQSFRESLGTTSLGFIAPLVVSVVSIVVTLYFVLKRRGREAMLKQLREDAIIAIGVVFIVTLLVYGPIFIYDGIVKTIYYDHQQLAANVRELKRSNPEKDAEIQGLRNRLTATCYMPDRRLTQTEQDTLHDSLRKIADKYHHPFVNVGFFDGDMESERYWYQIYLLFKEAGFRVPQPPDNVIKRRMRKSPNDPPALGSTDGLSIELETIQGNEQTLRNKLALEIAQAFTDAQVPMQTYPVGQGEALKEVPNELIVWVGIKKVDWLAAMKR